MLYFPKGLSNCFTVQIVSYLQLLCDYVQFGNPSLSLGNALLCTPLSSHGVFGRKQMIPYLCFDFALLNYLLSSQFPGQFIVFQLELRDAVFGHEKPVLYQHTGMGGSRGCKDQRCLEGPRATGDLSPIAVGLPRCLRIDE